MRLKHFIPQIERNNPLFWTVLLGFAPWLLVPLAYGKWGVAASIVFMSVSIAGLGFLTLFCFGFFDDRPSLRIVFSLGTGVIVQSGFFYFAVRFGFNSFLLYWSICALGGMGAVLLIRSLWQKPKGVLDSRRLWYLVLISIVVCLSYFMTDIRKNHVNTQDNGYSFLHPDSTFNMTVAAAIKNGVTPWNPLSGEVPLAYHYGSHSIAGSHAKVTGTSLGDGLLALAGVGLIALLSASVGLAALVTRMYGGDPIIGPIVGGASVFLYDIAKILRVGFRFVVKVSGFSVSDFGDITFWSGSAGHFLYTPFWSGSTGHFFYGHSTVWGSIGLIVILSLALWHWDKKEEGSSWCDASALSFLSVLVFPLNVFAGIAVSGTLAAVALIRSIKHWESWFFATIIVSTSIGILWAMGVTEGQALSDAAAVLQNNSPLISLLASSAERTATLFWVFLGFGVGLVPMGMIFSKHRCLLAQISLVLATGGFIFPSLFDMDIYANNLYFLRFFFHFSVVCAMAILSRGFREWIESQGAVIFIEQPIRVWRVIAFVSLIFLASQMCGWAISLEGVHPFYDGIVRISTPLLMAILSFWLWKNIKWSVAARTVSLMILAFIILLQIAGTARQIYIYAFKMPLISNNPLLVLDSNELKGLNRLRSVSDPDDLCATNRNLNGDRNLIGIGATFQLLYSPLSERRFLIETPFPFAKIGSEEVRSDNKLLFESSDAEAMRYVTNKYRIRYLVCAPGTDLALTINLPPWLYRVPDTGSLKIYEVRT
jgi:hypothetical protein